ncbi:hypothetical protein DPMN_126373 [Dreissena polymorpha]|uniref:Uncharacterized protein n=1 Tax=Dreissena polymorpha TaxID=45954 RepID=A0A9D4GVK7_DREPO|nr:hypothetical protein DPMN_126373 [Dreissena polymorpha]
MHGPGSGALCIVKLDRQLCMVQTVELSVLSSLTDSYEWSRQYSPMYCQARQIAMHGPDSGALCITKLDR